MSETYNPSAERRKEIVKEFQKLSARHSLRKAWEMFVVMSAVAIANTCGTPVQKESREKLYKGYADQITECERKSIARILELVTTELDRNPDQDLLGELFMSLGLGNQYKGQFFTPYPVSKCMNAMTFSAEEIKNSPKGFTSVGDPCCGAGAMLIAFANLCREHEINYQTSVLFAAQDIDFIAGCMCYIQLSLLGCAGYVVIDNSLTNPTITFDEEGLLPKNSEETVWYTPMYVHRDIWAQRRTIATLCVLTESVIKED
jgi:type I restriction-modification system DNA methylase subunit